MYKKKRLLVIFTWLLLTILILTFVEKINANETIYVDIAGSGDYNTIQDAIDAAKDGDTIYVKNGIYQENLVIDKEIYLLGEDSNNAIIDGNNRDDVIYVISDNVTITGFSIKNSGDEVYPNVDSGIDVRSKNIFLKNLYISNNNYGIYFYKADYGRIENCSIENNEYRGIYIDEGEGYKIAFNNIKNHSNNIYLSDVENSVIISNSISKSIQNGLFLGPGCYKNNISSNTFTGNDQGANVKGATENIFVNNVFINNVRGMYFCCEGENNLIYSNFFMVNDEHVYGYPINSFDNGSIGNFWDDYSGFDNDGDGIGDIAYVISDEFGEQNIDRYPIVNEDIDLDVDKDGLDNYLENNIGSDPLIKNNFTVLLLNNSEFYFVDIDYDDIYDILYDLISENIGITEKENGNYLMDYNSDGEWDYILSNDGELTLYEENKDVGTPGFEFFMVSLVFIILVIILKTKKIR